MRISLGFPPKEAERQLILGTNERDYSTLPVRIDPSKLIEIQQQIKKVAIGEPVVDYILNLVAKTRIEGEFANALSPRASIALAKAAKAWAFINARDYVTPEDVQAIFESVTAHRLGLAHHSSKQQIENLIKSVSVPL